MSKSDLPPQRETDDPQPEALERRHRRRREAGERAMRRNDSEEAPLLTEVDMEAFTRLVDHDGVAVDLDDALVAVIDREGTIAEVDDRWRRAADAPPHET